MAMALQSVKNSSIIQYHNNSVGKGEITKAMVYQVQNIRCLSTQNSMWFMWPKWNGKKEVSYANTPEYIREKMNYDNNSLQSSQN